MPPGRATANPFGQSSGSNGIAYQKCERTKPLVSPIDSARTPKDADRIMIVNTNTLYEGTCALASFEILIFMLSLLSTTASGKANSGTVINDINLPRK